MNLIDTAVARVREAVEKYNPIAIVALFSGGHDSGTASLIAHESGADTTLHINTGIGVEQTRDYVRDICSERKWSLKEYKAVENTKADGTPDPQIYADMVRENGFPGKPGHLIMYSSLKERQLARFERDIGATSKKPVLYVGGARTDESSRRMLNMKKSGMTYKKGRVVFCNPIHDFTKSDCHSCMEHCGLRRNVVVDLIHKSGECLCGAFAERGELAELKLWFPDTAKIIEDLEREVFDKFPWGWEDGPPEWEMDERRGQPHLFDMPLCHRCNLNYETKKNQKTETQQTIQ